MYKKKPFFIVFEGVEGCGKSYQSKKLYNNLKKLKIKSILTREPGGTHNAEVIRNLILKDYFLKNKKIAFHRYTDTFLYLAARNEHVQDKIIPALKSKTVVICDRFIDSTYAYQVHGKKVNKNLIDEIHKIIIGKYKPNLTIVLKVTTKSSRQRIKKRRLKNRYDKFSDSFYKSVQKSFLKRAKDQKKYVIFESSKNTPKLEKDILNLVLKRLR